MGFVTARQGRDLQRYSNTGGRLVVGCIPYKLDVNGGGGGGSSSTDDGKNDIHRSLEVLVISSQKGNKDIVFPKGGWESDETMIEAALREAFEEAGVQGILEDMLGTWEYKSRRHDVVYEGIMFPMNVTVEYEQWPEKEARERKWVKLDEAKEGCPHLWMREALDALVDRLSSVTNIRRTSDQISSC